MPPGLQLGPTAAVLAYAEVTFWSRGGWARYNKYPR